MHAASAVSASASVTENPNPTLVLPETSATPMEEGIHALPPPSRPRPPAMEKRPLRSSPPPPLVLNKPHLRNICGGGTTSPSLCDIGMLQAGALRLALALGIALLRKCIRLLSDVAEEQCIEERCLGCTFG